MYSNISYHNITHLMQENLTPQVQPKQNSWYIPWSTEKKKCVMMYLLLGIVLSLSKEKMSRFEYFHLRQSVGRRMLFVVLLLAAVVFLLLPIIWFVGWLLICWMLVFWGLFVKQAREGKYRDIVDQALMPLFVGVWWRVLQMFDMNIHLDWDEATQDESVPQV